MQEHNFRGCDQPNLLFITNNKRGKGQPRTGHEKSGRE